MSPRGEAHISHISGAATGAAASPKPTRAVDGQRWGWQGRLARVLGALRAPAPASARLQPCLSRALCSQRWESRSGVCTGGHGTERHGTAWGGTAAGPPAPWHTGASRGCPAAESHPSPTLQVSWGHWVDGGQLDGPTVALQTFGGSVGTALAPQGVEVASWGGGLGDEPVLPMPPPAPKSFGASSSRTHRGAPPSPRAFASPGAATSSSSSSSSSPRSAASCEGKAAPWAAKALPGAAGSCSKEPAPRCPSESHFGAGDRPGGGGRGGLPPGRCTAPALLETPGRTQLLLGQPP